MLNVSIKNVLVSREVKQRLSNLGLIMTVPVDYNLRTVMLSGAKHPYRHHIAGGNKSSLSIYRTRCTLVTIFPEEVFPCAKPC
jgi:hypothetical protein